MRLLLIDTCGQEGSLALVDTELALPVMESVMLVGRVASERLIPELRRLMGAHRLRMGDLTAIGVVAGPGSFTGVRVGMAAAKGLCEAGLVPLVMVSRLAVLAEKAGELANGVPEPRHALLDAGRGEFFYGRYEAGEASIEALLGGEAVLTAVAGEGRVGWCEESVGLALGKLDVLGNLAESGGSEVVRVDGLRAADALGLVRARVEQGAFDDVASSDASYLRRTDLEMLARLAERAAGA